MSDQPRYYVSVESVKHEIQKVIDDNERFIRGRTDRTEVYVGEVVLTQLRRILKVYEKCLGVLMVPYKKAFWIFHDPGFWECSGCGHAEHFYNRTPYCPQCGAEMDANCRDTLRKE